MRYLGRQDGFVRPVLCLASLAFIVYSGFQFGLPYYRYSGFNNEARDIVRVGHGNPEKIKARIYKTALDLKVPLEADDIKVTLKDQTLQVRTSWAEEVDLLGIYHKTLYFYIDIED